MKEYGLDLSVHNGTLDFNAIKTAGNTFVILRAGYGSAYEDKKFDEYYKKAKAAGLKIGAYWYSYALNTAGAKAEANKMLEVIKGKTFEYPVFIDMEDADQYKKKHGMPSNATLCAICETFCEIVENAGYYVGVYASESWFNGKLKNMSKAYDRWVANWGSNNGTLQSDKSATYRLHQFTSVYYLNGKRLDRNVSYLDYAGVIKNAGLNGFKKTTSEAKPIVTEKKKTVEEVAQEIYKGIGNWGDGDVRRKKVTDYGLDYDTVQTRVNQLCGLKPATKSTAIKKGDKVKVKKAINYDNGKTFGLYYDKYDVIEVKGDRVVIGIGKTVTAPINKKYLTKV